MITLTGILRQSGEITIKEKPLVKLWVEHEMPRDNGQAGDLKIEEFFIDKSAANHLPKQGGTVSVNVRPYVVGRDIRYQCTGLAPQTPLKTA